MNSESYSFISCTRRNSSSVKLSREKCTVEASNISATFSDAIIVARSLNTAIKSMCPACLEIIRQALSEEEAVTNENYDVEERLAK
jgi:hypothetical protein